MQREMAVHGEPKKVQAIPYSLLKMCEGEIDALRLCVHLSGFTHDFIRQQMSIDKGNFSRMLQGQAGFPTAKRISLMRLCGNYAPVQYECAELGLVAVAHDEYKRLLAAAAELEAIKADGTCKARANARWEELQEVKALVA